MGNNLRINGLQCREDDCITGTCTFSKEYGQNQFCKENSLYLASLNIEIFPMNPETLKSAEAQEKLYALLAEICAPLRPLKN